MKSKRSWPSSPEALATISTNGLSPSPGRSCPRSRHLPARGNHFRATTLFGKQSQQRPTPRPSLVEEALLDPATIHVTGWLMRPLGQTAPRASMPGPSSKWATMVVDVWHCAAGQRSISQARSVHARLRLRAARLAPRRTHERPPRGLEAASATRDDVCPTSTRQNYPRAGVPGLSRSDHLRAGVPTGRNRPCAGAAVPLSQCGLDRDPVSLDAKFAAFLPHARRK